MNITLSTGNPGKVKEIETYITDTMPWITIVSLAETGIPPPPDDLEDDGQTIYDNALAKARYAHRPGEYSMADDTGLSIVALEGRPGKDARTWAGKYATRAEITTHTLRELAGKKDRRATFETMIVLILPQGNARSFFGMRNGILLEAERGEPRLGMPYSAIFQPDCDTRVLAEMSVSEENKISHRGLALAQMKTFLESLPR